MSNQPHVYLTDAPIVRPKDDQFQRWPFAERIAETIANQRDTSSMVIAIYGAWGSGKTTVLNFIHKALEDQENVTPLKYNPWRYTTEDQMLAGFMQFLADALKRTLKTTGEEVVEVIAKYVKCLAPVLPGTEAAANLARDLSGVRLDDLKERIGKALDEEGKRLVVLIDDIDRLDELEIHALFRLIKLTGDFSNVTYVLAFDHDVVAASLAQRYGNGGRCAGASFLEKIIQVPLNLPTVHKAALREYAFSCLNRALEASAVELSEKQVLEFLRHYTHGIEPRLTTPRMCKRYANALSFALPILGDEVNPVDLMVIEGIRILYPKLYKTLPAQKEAIFESELARTSSDKEAPHPFKQAVDASLADYDNMGKQAAISLIRDLFPQTGDLFDGGMRHDPAHCEPVWYKAKCVASQAYFDRYFSYAIPAGDMPDREVDELIYRLPDVRGEQLEDDLKRLAEKYDPGSLVGKLRVSAEDLPAEASKILAKALVRVAGAFPRPDSPAVLFSTPFAQAAILVENLLNNMPKEERLAEAKELLKGATSLPFALQLLTWLKPLEGETDYDERVRKEFDDALGGVLAERIKAASATCDFLSEYPRDLQSVLWVWAKFGDSDATRSYVENFLEADDNTVTQFLMSYTPSVWSEFGKLRRGHFEREQYDSVTSIVSAESIIHRLRKMYGDALDDPRDRFGKFEDDAEWVAHQFCRVHLAATKQETVPPGPQCE